VQQKRTKPRPRQSLRLTPGASEWQGNVRCSLRIASDRGHPSHPVRDNLPAQRAIIALCRDFIGDRFTVHVPRRGAPVLSCLQLRSFSKLPHTVYGFSSGKISGSWLHLEEDSGRYFLGTRTWVVDKSQRRYIRDSLPEYIKKINL
jgi:hypothetical protein